MSSSSIERLWPGGRLHVHRVTSELIVRFTLAAIAVGICYCFQWEALRSLTLELNSRLDALCGVHLQRLSFDSVMWDGRVFRYVIACTMADVWCACLPLLWDMQNGVGTNIRKLAVFTVGLLGFNVFRLSVSDVLVAAGLSWNLGHNVISGIAYFASWKFLWKQPVLKRLSQTRTFHLDAVGPQ